MNPFKRIRAREVGEPSGPQARTARADELVRGERTSAIVQATRSAQSRLSSVLAAGLMLTLGLSALGWYYANALTRGARARQAAQSTATSRAQGEMPLPDLGRIAAPLPPPAEPAHGGDTAALASPGHAPELPPVETPASPTPLGSAGAYAAMPGGRAAPLARTPAELALERRLSGGVLAREADSETARAPAARAPAADAASGLAAADSGGSGSASAHRDPGGEALAELLHAPPIRAVPAQLLPNRRFLLPQGSFIDCTLETAIDSTLPGMTTCITAADTFGADGKVVLLERGTKLVGETRGQVQQGQARVFVLWTQARTPAGVVVPLASPGTDELGRAGLPGEVQRHFWQRFGAAMLISLIDGAVQAGVQASTRSSGTLIYAPSASRDVLTEALKDTAGIAPTVIKHNGDRIQVLIARDLDFRPVYELRAPASGR